MENYNGLINGNSDELLPKMIEEGIKVDLILTDPPYNIAKYSTGNINLPNRAPLNNNIAEWDNIEINPEDYLEDFKRIIKPAGNIFIFTT